jgi:glycosyltransferase involved in cell wall biosynthesis
VNIVHFSTSDFGGAGKAALRIHNECLDANLNSKLYVLNSNSRGKHVYIKSCLYRRIINFPINRFHNFQKSLFVKNRNSFYSIKSSRNNLSVDVLKKAIKPDTDLVVIHWVAGFIDLAHLAIALESRKAKVILYLMDMAMLTGGCHFSHGCERYTSICSNCPEASSEKYRAIISENHFNKIKSSIKLKPHILASSNYLLDQAKRSPLMCAGYEMTRPPLNQTFTFKDKIYDSGGLFKVLLGAYSRGDERKGYKIAVVALAILDDLLKDRDMTIELMVPTLDFRDDMQSFSNIKLIKYDFAKDDNALADLYNRADLLFNTSLDDSGPMLVLESQMCGTPFVATSVGVAKELNQFFPGNGVIVESNDAPMMAYELFRAIENKVCSEGRKEIAIKARDYYENVLSNVANFSRINSYES